MRYLVILLFFMPLVLGDYYQAQELTVDLNIDNSLIVGPERDDYALRRVGVEMTFFPREDFRQQIVEMETSPKHKLKNDAFVFEWIEPDETELPFSLNARIRTTNNLATIDEKIAFPIRNLPDDLKIYLEETPTIDYTAPEIMGLGSRLAHGEDDLYIMVHKLGVWVNKNIKYDLNTKTADASQRASWVLRNEQGVCDEITNLFIGLCRSLGIPARFVSGLSYSNLDIFEEDWSPHGWAEVYFPGYGWIPFDVTYGELGYIDPAHIKLKDAVDANRSSTKYEWEGYNVNMDIGRLKMKTTVVDAYGSWQPFVILDADILKKKNGFSSYNAIEVEVKNPYDFYVPVELLLSRSEGTKLFDDYNRLILLRPNEEKKEYWIFQLDSDLDRDFIYNFTFKAYTIRNASSSVSLSSSDQFKRYSLQEIRDLIDESKQEDEKVYSENLELKCSAEDIYYISQSADIICTIYNYGNVELYDIDICMSDECHLKDLSIGQRADVIFQKKLLAAGPQDMLVTAKNDEVSKSSNVEFVVWARPDVEFSELKYPRFVKLDKTFTIEFKLEPKTSSIPNNVTISLVSDSFEQTWKLDSLQEKRSYILNVDKYALADIHNDFKIFVSYSDNLGRMFSNREDFKISLEDVTLKHRGIMLINKISTSLRYEIVIVILSMFIAGIVVGLIFRARDYHRRYL